MIYKRLLTIGLIMATGLSLVSLWPVSAQQEQLSDDHISRIQANCVSVKQRLNQLHANDALLRVNRGQMYEALSVKLMATLNSRIALNRLDGGGMVETTAAYNQELGAFRESYKIYERQLSAAIKINCNKSPQEFYEATQKASEERKAVHEHVLRLHDYIRDYQDEFDKFYRNFENDEKDAA